jgi:hypothetical protein
LTGPVGGTHGRVMFDPKQYPCPACGAQPMEPCVRLSGPYGLGNALRRTHPERRTAGIEAEVRRTPKHVG